MWIVPFFLFLCSWLEACTAFHLKAQDGSLIYCRSLEFGMKMDSHFLIVPRGTPYTGNAPGNKTGMQWQTKYGFVGLNQTLDRNLVSDGLNEKGLVVGMLYLPGYAKYETFDPAQIDKTIGGWQLGTYLLSTCQNLAEVRSILPTLQVAEQLVPSVNFSIPLHFYVSDASGAVLIIEYVDGKRHIYDNPIGILTNSPPFDWHMTNLNNYIKLSPYNTQPTLLGHYKLQGFGQGTGALGMPGDFSPPSRFVRAAFYSHWANPTRNALESVRLGFHILNTFDIFPGAIQDHSKPKGDRATDTTEWVIVHDQTNLKTYARSYDSLTIQKIDLTKIDFNQKGFKEIPLAKDFTPVDITPSAKPSLTAHLN